MVEPIALSLAIISLVGSIALAIINLFRNPFNCQGLKSDCLKSSCCMSEGDVVIDGNNNKVKV
jgi:hypothetical protein